MCSVVVVIVVVGSALPIKGKNKKNKWNASVTKQKDNIITI